MHHDGTVVEIELAFTELGLAETGLGHHIINTCIYKTYTYKHKQVQLVNDELHPMGLDDDVSIPICLLHSSLF